MREIDSQLFEAVEQNDGEKVLSLLDAGADFGAIGKSGATAVACAIRNIPDFKLLISLLARQGAAGDDIDRLVLISKYNPNPEVELMMREARRKYYLALVLICMVGGTFGTKMVEAVGWGSGGGMLSSPIFLSALSMLVFHRSFFRLTFRFLM